MEVVIRKIEERDYERFSFIMDEVQALHVCWRPDIYREVSPLISRETFAEFLSGDNWYVAEADGVVAGVLEIFPRHIEAPTHVTRDVLYVSTMAVEEKYRGRGIGSRFFAFVKQIRKEKGYDAIELQVNARNDAALAMYRAIGFTEKSVNMELI